MLPNCVVEKLFFMFVAFEFWSSSFFFLGVLIEEWIELGVSWCVADDESIIGMSCSSNLRTV